MTELRGSRTSASIRGGAHTSARGLVACILLAVACDSESERRSELTALDSPVTETSKVGDSPWGAARPAARLVSIRVFGAEREDAVGARVVLELEGAPLFKQTRLPPQGPLPARISVELEDTTVGPKVRPLLDLGRAGIARIRLAPPGARVVIDLLPEAHGRTFYLTDPHRIVIDVQAPTVDRTDLRPFVVVLDPGHGGSEPGAANRTYDLVESHLALEIAELTKRRLVERLPGARVLLTRTDDSGLSLEARCALANAMEADAFVSIHLNAGTGEVRRGGVSTFVLDTTNDRQALRLAVRGLPK